MAEDDRLSAAPVFIIDVDVLSVFFSCSYVWHDGFSFGSGCTLRYAGPWQNQAQFMFLQSTASSCKFSANLHCWVRPPDNENRTGSALIWRNANQIYCCSREATKALTAN